MPQYKRFQKRGKNPDHHVFLYMDPPKWYVRIGGLETPRFRHGLALASDFDKEEDARKFKQDVIQYLGDAFNIHWKKKKK